MLTNVDKNVCIYNTISQAIKAADNWNSPIHSVRHIVRHGKQWVIMGHINCESCDHCNDYPLNDTKHAITLEV